MFGVAELVKVRRLSDDEGRRLERLVRRGDGKGNASVVRPRRVGDFGLGGREHGGGDRGVGQTSPDRVREVIHNFNEKGLACLDPRWAGSKYGRSTGRSRSRDREQRRPMRMPGERVSSSDQSDNCDAGTAGVFPHALGHRPRSPDRLCEWATYMQWAAAGRRRSLDRVHKASGDM